MKLSEHFEQKGVIQLVEGKHDESIEMTDEEFFIFFRENEGDLVPIHMEQRIKFLEDNGYEVTHANLVNADLPAKLRLQEK